jgi:hypothetical protein
MTLTMSRKKILLACCMASTLLAAACASDAKTGQTPQTSDPQAKSTLSEQIERSADQPLRVVFNEEPPFKIVEAKVKVISGPQFTELTGAATDFAVISSVPEITLVNTSGKTITEFTVILRNPKLRAGRSMLQRKVSVAPGESYVVKRDHFLTPGKASGGGGSTSGGRPPGLPGMESEQYWVTFGEQSDLFVTVYKVSFDDGSSWLLKEGGEVR